MTGARAPVGCLASSQPTKSLLFAPGGSDLVGHAADPRLAAGRADGEEVIGGGAAAGAGPHAARAADAAAARCPRPAGRGQAPTALRSASTRSVRSQVNSGSSRPKCP
jgi:hypothetical protein